VALCPEFVTAMLTRFDIRSYAIKHSP